MTAGGMIRVTDASHNGPLCLRPHPGAPLPGCPFGTRNPIAQLRCTAERIILRELLRNRGAPRRFAEARTAGCNLQD